MGNVDLAELEADVTWKNIQRLKILQKILEEYDFLELLPALAGDVALVLENIAAELSYQLNTKSDY